MYSSCKRSISRNTSWSAIYISLQRNIPKFDTVLLHSNWSSLRRKYLSKIPTDVNALSCGAKTWNISGISDANSPARHPPKSSQHVRACAAGDGAICSKNRIIVSYYMASSVSGQEESNPALWLATRAGKMELSCPLGTTRHVPQEKFSRKPYNKSFIDQAFSAKMAGYWPRSFFACLWTSTPSWSINTQKKNLANVQPSWPHTWSITHIYFFLKHLSGPESKILEFDWLIIRTWPVQLFTIRPTGRIFCK